MKEVIVDADDLVCLGKDKLQEVIRCKDCKHCRTYYHGENMPFSYACDRLYLTNNLSVNDYCSRAEKDEK